MQGLGVSSSGLRGAPGLRAAERGYEQRLRVKPQSPAAVTGREPSQFAHSASDLAAR